MIWTAAFEAATVAGAGTSLAPSRSMTAAHLILILISWVVYTCLSRTGRESLPPFGVFKFAQSGANNLAGVVVPAGGNQAADQVFEVFGEGHIHVRNLE
jgi:hypothetical protein